MALDPGIGDKVTATILSVNGDCSAGHKTGDAFEISCHDSGGLCGYFYHDIFPSLQTFQFGGQMPWWGDEDTIELKCPDHLNQVTLRLVREKR